MVSAGKLYINGLGIEKDPQKALELFQQAMKLDNAEAYLQTGLIYDNGNGVDVDTKKAYELFKYSAEKNNALAMVYYANKLIIGKDCEKNVDLGKSFLKKSIDLGEKEAMYEFAEFNYAENDIDSALEYYIKAADKGHIKAQNNAAFLLYEKDPLKALEYWEKAAQAGDIYASINYGLKLAEGRGCVKNLYLAKKYLQEASETGNLEALYNYGVLLSTTGDSQDLNDAKRVLKTAADRGHIYAMYNYAILIYNSLQLKENDNSQININIDALNSSISDQNQENIQLVIQLLKQAAENGCDEALSLAAYLMVENKTDLETAAEFAQKASSNGDMNAKLLYATMLFTGKGVPKDIDTASAMLKELGAKGISEAYYQYGVALYDGIELPQDQNEGNNYFQKAAELGNESAQLRIDE